MSNFTLGKAKHEEHTTVNYKLRSTVKKMRGSDSPLPLPKQEQRGKKKKKYLFKQNQMLEVLTALKKKSLNKFLEFLKEELHQERLKMMLPLRNKMQENILDKSQHLPVLFLYC